MRTRQSPRLHLDACTLGRGGGTPVTSASWLQWGVSAPSSTRERLRSRARARRQFLLTAPDTFSRLYRSSMAPSTCATITAGSHIAS